MKSIMVDNETLATTADAVIISIGAVKFDLVTGVIDDEGFYMSVSIDSNLELGRRITEDTLNWWMKQSPAARQVFQEPKQTLAFALEKLSAWVGRGDYEVWSNGASFDIPMLEHAYLQCGLKAPWKFWNARCFRTWKNLPAAKNVALPDAEVKHNALSDAINQAEQAIAIHTAMKGKI